MLSDGTYEYEYDKEGNRTKRTEIATDDYVVYTWDHRNRLVTVTEKDNADATLKAVDQIYDTYNRWIGRNVDTTSPFDMADAAETHFIYDGNQIILEFDDTQPNDLRHRYLWGPAIDQILSDEQYDPADPAHDDPSSEEGIVLWPLTDHLNTVRDIAEYDSASGTALLVNHLEYNSFGLVTSEKDTTVDVLFLYTARPFDQETNLQNNLNRWYDVLVGIWISEDPIGFAGGDTNVGRYVKNQPVIFVDPSGLAPPVPFNYGPISNPAQTAGMAELTKLEKRSTDLAKKNFDSLQAALRKNRLDEEISFARYKLRQLQLQLEKYKKRIAYCAKRYEKTATRKIFKSVGKEQRSLMRRWLGVGKKDAVKALKEGKRLPKGLKKSTLEAYREVARRALTGAKGDPVGTQKARWDLIQTVLCPF